MSVAISSVYHSDLLNLVVPDELTRKLRRADDFIKLAVVPAFAILNEQIGKTAVNNEDFGLIIGSAYGTMQTNFDVLDLVVTGQQSSPTLFSHSVFNAAAGYTAAVLNIRGCALTVTDFAFPFFRALQEGYLALASGRLSRCLVFQVETYSDLLHDARRKELPECELWQPGVVCWLLENHGLSKKSFATLKGLEILDNSSEPADTLNFTEHFMRGKENCTVKDPLGIPKHMTNLLKAGSIEESTFQINAAWGKVEAEILQI